MRQFCFSNGVVKICNTILNNLVASDIFILILYFFESTNKPLKSVEFTS